MEKLNIKDFSVFILVFLNYFYGINCQERFILQKTNCDVLNSNLCFTENLMISSFSIKPENISKKFKRDLIKDGTTTSIENSPDNTTEYFNLELNSTETTNYFSTTQETICNEKEDENCTIDHNLTCVGDEQYCNLTYEEYTELLNNYIYPTTNEWILIVSHMIVFIMGLVSSLLFIITFNSFYIFYYFSFFILICFLSGVGLVERDGALDENCNRYGWKVCELYGMRTAGMEPVMGV